MKPAQTQQQAPGVSFWDIFLIIIAALLALASLALLWGCDQPEARANGADGPKAVNVHIQPLVPGTISDVRILPGEVEALEDIVLSAECEGVVEWIGPAEGEDVERDQLIARIDLQTLQTALDKAEANLGLAQKQARRRQDLFDRRVATREELDEALTTLNLARATLQEAQAAYERGVIRSPITGVLDDLHIDPGEYVSPGTPIAELVNIRRVRVIVNVPERDIPHISPGASVPLLVDAYPEKRWTGTIDSMAHKADPATRSYPVRLLVDNPDNSLLPGMIVRAALECRRVDNALSVPLSTILDRGGERLVFVEQDGLARARPVSLGVVQGDRIEIVQGLAPGDKLITAGHTEVEDGTPVVVR